eukprot:2416810-Karenia_brevis.AAC.1
MEIEAKNKEKTKLLSDTTRKTAFKKLAAASLPPIQSLRDDTGNFTAKPHEMDEILQRAWKTIYDGNVSNIIPMLVNYFG